MAASAPRPPAPAPTPSVPRSGAFRETGTVRHASIHAQRYRLKGTGKVTGEVDVDEAAFDGIVTITGPLNANRLDVRGTFEGGGDVGVSGAMALRGTGRFLGALRAGELSTDGLVRIAKGLQVVRTLSARGALEVGGDLESAFFGMEGRVAIAGVVRAKEVDGIFESESAIREIEAVKVSLRPRQLIRLPVEVPVLSPNALLKVDRIEAEAVQIEGVEVGYIRAESIVLGRHCHVTRLDGTLVKKDPTSHVGYESRTAPPRGLSR